MKMDETSESGTEWFQKVKIIGNNGEQFRCACKIWP